MKIVVAGLWHLGSVTAACLAEAGFSVLGYEPRQDILTRLREGHGPVAEPGLDALIQKNVQAGGLSFSDNPSLCYDADVVWITFDTPVDEHDKADTGFVFDHIKQLYPYINDGTVVLISSQVPVGSTHRLSKIFHQAYLQKRVNFAYSPENLRLGSAIQVFTQPDRVVIGLDDPLAKEKLQALFKPFTDNILWMSCLSAEMTKHAINAFLANSVVFANELATLCDAVGAKASEVEAGLKSESRIGPKAYLRAGAAFAGGTLARDVNYLIDIGQHHHVETTLFPAIMASNEMHKRWIAHQLALIWPDLRHKKIGVLGLTYKPDTDTLVRSSAMALCTWLFTQGVKLHAYEPMLTTLPPAYDDVVTLRPSLSAALQQTDAIIITKRHGHFDQLDEALQHTSRSELYIFDETGFYRHLAQHRSVHYICLGGV